MKNEQGFSLIELLIVVAIIAIIAAIAVPSMLTARMAANESGAIQGCRTVGSAEMAFASVNNQTFTTLQALVDGGYLDSRFGSGATGFNGYNYAEGNTVTGATNFDATIQAVLATPLNADSSGRYNYGIGADQVVRYMGVAGGADPAKCGVQDCVNGDPIGMNKS
ncbi:MAG: prepilin-type N-terminal cleavage/methylation domain-containing protein [Acidobacteriota bacterium]